MNSNYQVGLRMLPTPSASSRSAAADQRNKGLTTSWFLVARGTRDKPPPGGYVHHGQTVFQVREPGPRQQLDAQRAATQWTLGFSATTWASAPRVYGFTPA